jgi:FMN phosphatase YigB (HAD superfamily)
MSKFKALLLDLDNTLFLFNEDAFLVSYAQLAAPYFTDVLDESTFFQKLLRSTMHMLRNNGSQTNVEAFTHDFITGLPTLTYQECYNRFDRFYREAFGQLRNVVQTVPAGRGVVQRAIRADIQVAIATNPIFPDAATHYRLEWAGIDDLPIAIVTHAENMRYCKPHPEYFLTILDILERQPKECLMVGNDPISDMSAAEVGIKTFLVELEAEKGRLGMISKQVGQQAREVVSKARFRIDWRGTLQDVERVLLRA